MIKQCTFFSCNDWNFLRENIEGNIENNKFKHIDAAYLDNERIGFINFADDSYIVDDENSDNFVIAVRIEKRVLTQQIIDNEYQKYLNNNKDKDKDKLLSISNFADELRKKALCKSDVYFVVFCPSVNLVIIGATGAVAEEIRCLLLRSFDFKLCVYVNLINQNIRHCKRLLIKVVMVTSSFQMKLKLSAVKKEK